MGIRFCISMRQPTPSGSGPRASMSAASSPRTNRLSRSSGSSPAPSPSTASSIGAATPAAHLELDPVVQVEREPEAVVTGAQVRGGRRDLDRQTTAVQLGQPMHHHVSTSPCQHITMAP